jgi:hypothetical protein
MFQSSQIGKISILPLFLIILTVIYPVYSQETAPSPAPVNEELQRWIDRNKLLEEQKKAAQNEAAIATANKEKVAAQFPKPNTSPLAGDAKVDASVKIESEIMAYQALAKNSDAIVEDIKKNTAAIRSLAILNQPMIQNLQLYSAITLQLKKLQAEYDSAIIFPTPAEEAKIEEITTKLKALSEANKTFSITTTDKAAGTTAFIGTLGAATSLIGGFVDILSFFRTDTSLTGSSYTVKESAFVSEMYRAVKNKYPGAKFYYPSEFTPKPNGLDDYEVTKQVNTLNAMRLKSELVILVIEDLEKNIKEIETKLGALKARKNQISFEIFKSEDEVSALEKINKKYPSAVNYEKLEMKRLVAKTLLRESLNIPNQIKELESALAENKERLKTTYSFIKYVYPKDAKENIESLILIQQKQNIARLKALNSQFGAFYNTLIKPETTGTNPLGALLVAETMRSILCSGDNDDSTKKSEINEASVNAAKKNGEEKYNSCQNSYILALNVVNAGGSNMTKKNLITNVFTGADIKHSGGVITEFRLYDIDGNIKRAQTFTTYEPYKKAKEINK